MKNAFCFILKLFFFLTRYLWLDFKDKNNFEIDDITAWLTNNYNSHIAQYLPN